MLTAGHGYGPIVPGETDLQAMLDGLTVTRRSDDVTVLRLPDAATGEIGLAGGVLALVAEDEGPTVVATVDEAERRGWPIDFVAAWLTLDVHSSLEAVGLTAAFSRALADAGIACNVVAGFHHDHLLVPVDCADDAVQILENLSRP